MGRVGWQSLLLSIWDRDRRPRSMTAAASPGGPYGLLVPSAPVSVPLSLTKTASPGFTLALMLHHP